MVINTRTYVKSPNTSFITGCIQVAPASIRQQTRGEETATKAGLLFCIQRCQPICWKVEGDGWKKEKKTEKTRSPAGICHSSATQPMQIQFDFNSLILDCIIWDVIKISHCFSREQQSVSQKPRRRYAKRLSVLLAQTSRYRADYALLAVHGDLIVRSKLTVFHRCEAEPISLG